MKSSPNCSSELPPTKGAEPQAMLTPGLAIFAAVSFVAILYFGALYVDQNGGGFEARVYAPYASVKQLTALQPKKGGDEFLEKGKDLFSRNCAVCHQENGLGSAGNGCPPLAGSEWATGTPARLVRIISKGLSGPIKVKGQDYGTGTMPNIGDSLPGDEKEKAESIAAIASYIRTQWGNKAPGLKPAEVAKIRDEIKGHASSFTSAELEAVK